MGMMVFDKEFPLFVQNEMVFLIKFTKNTSANKLVSKAAGVFTMPSFAPVAA